MMKFTVSFIVAKNSGINKILDLKGKRIASGFKAAPLFTFVTSGALAAGGLTYDDVKRVPAVGLVQHWRMFMQGKVDAVISAAGTGFAKQMNAKIKGGIKHLTFPKTPKALEALQSWFPHSQWADVKPRKGLTGVIAPTTFTSYDFVLWTHKGLPDEVVYKVTKVMHQQAKQLKQGGPLWRSYEANARLQKDHGYPYHKGAIKYYKEAGLWKR